MPDETKPEVKPEQTAPVAQAKPRVKPGDKIHLVHAKGHHLEGECTKVSKDGNKIDLTAQNGAEEITITSSPHDPTGTKPDSWHVAD